jgi:CPA2 family monovalent cation:H+ antiporter-2
MSAPHEFLAALATVLCVAGVMSVLSRALRLPLVLGYVLAGLVVGPHVPIPLVADREIVRTLSELGVILLMFSLGLEFEVRRLAQLAPTAGLTALIECSAMFWLGSVVAEALGFSPRESLYAGAIVAISSTTAIVKAFDEARVRRSLREGVIGVLIFEDVLAILLLALLPAIALGATFSWSALGLSVVRLTALLALGVGLGFLIVPPALRAVLRLRRSETTLVASLGVCFAAALLADAVGYSVALGAFVAGSLVAEADAQHAVRGLIEPVRDLFVAIYFVSVGMSIEPQLVLEHVGAVFALGAVVWLGKSAFVALGAFLAGRGTRSAVETGLSLAQIGEFSFIIAGVGVATGAVGTFLAPVAITVSALTMATTPLAIRIAPRAAALLDRKLPRRLQTFATLYGSWLERVRSAPRERSYAARLRRLAGLLALDVAALAVLAIAAATWGDALAAALAAAVGAKPQLARVAVGAAIAALAIPLVVGLARVARQVGLTIARSAFPEVERGSLDLSVAPRGALVVAIQLATLMLALLPLLAALQPVLPPSASAVAAPLLLAIVVYALWRSTADLQGHVRAGASALAEALARRARGAGAAEASADVGVVRALLPGLGEPEDARISSACFACNRTLSELDLRGLSGATVLAIARDGRSIVLPAASEALRAGDVVTLAGTHDAIASARRLLEQGSE